MGGRLSRPAGPAGLTEASNAPPPRRPPVNLRTIVGPVGIVTMGVIFFVYSRTSVKSAKESARRHREADGGKIDWRNESARRHGTLKSPDSGNLLQQLFRSETEEEKTRKTEELNKAYEEARKKRGSNPIEDGIRRAREKSERSKGE